MGALIDYLAEAAFSSALQAIAMGESYDTTRGSICDDYPRLSIFEIDDILADALKDALAQGVEREDVDPSWF